MKNDNNYFGGLFSSLGTAFKDTVDTAILGITPDEEIKQYHSDWNKVPDSFLSENHLGFRYGTYAIKQKDSFMHSLIVGASGTGKTSSTILNTILSANGNSMVIHDPSMELHKRSSGYLRSKYYNIIVLDFSRPSISNYYNPLAQIKDSGDIGKVANILVRSVMSFHSDPFWSQSAESLLKCMIEITLKLDESYRNLANVKHLVTLLATNPEQVDALVSRVADEKLFLTYKYLISQTEKTFSGIISSVQAVLKIFDDPNVALATSSQDFDFASIRKKPTAIYLVNNMFEVNYFSALLGLFIEQLTKVMMQQLPEKNDLPVFYILDEVTTLAKAMPSLPLILSNSRKYNLGFLLAVQELQALQQYFGNDSQTIISNCYTKVFYPSQNYDTALRLEAILGKRKITLNNGQEQILPLYTADQIRQLPSDMVIMVAGNRAPYKFNVVPYYKQFFMNWHSQHTPAPLHEKNILSCPIINLIE